MRERYERFARIRTFCNGIPWTPAIIPTQLALFPSLQEMHVHIHTFTQCFRSHTVQCNVGKQFVRDDSRFQQSHSTRFLFNNPLGGPVTISATFPPLSWTTFGGTIACILEPNHALRFRQAARHAHAELRHRAHQRSASILETGHLVQRHFHQRQLLCQSF